MRIVAPPNQPEHFQMKMFVVGMILEAHERAGLSPAGEYTMDLNALLGKVNKHLASMSAGWNVHCIRPDEKGFYPWENMEFIVQDE